MSRLRYRPPVTKLYPPSTDSRLLERPDLVSTLVSLQQRKLAVVTAPTGSGKSTLLAQGFRKLVAAGWDAAWLSLDRFDNEPRVFVLNLLAALGQVRPGFGDQVASQIQASAEVPLTEAMAAIIGECAARPAVPAGTAGGAQPLAIFLDDFQAIDNADVVAAVGYLIQYSGAETRFVVASQRQVPLSVARLKSRGAVVEIGFADLRLAADEVREYLRRVHRVALSDERVEALTDQTEGWICGLQLASIAYREHGDALFSREAGLATGAGVGVGAGARAGAGFADYLLEDILARQPPAVRAFLQDTALLEQFCAPLCDALTGRPDSTEMIEALEQASLFIIRLDREQIWYRYHHLFQNFLRMQKRSQGLASLRPLYLRASRWYEQNAMPAEALRHALAGGGSRAAVRLLETYGYSLLREGSFKELHAWLQAVGRKAVSSSAELNVLDAWTQLYLGDAIAASEAIDSAQAVLASGGSGDAPAGVAPRRGHKRLADELLILRSMCGVTRYDLVDSEWIRPELATAFGLEDGLQRAYAQVVLGYGARVDGELAAARRHYVEAIRIADANEDTVVSLMARYNRAMVDQLVARPDIAIRGLTQWLEEPGNRRWLRAGSAAFLRSVLGLAHLDRLEFAGAEAALDAAIDLLDSTHTFAYVGVARVLRAQVYALTHRVDLAQDDIDKAKELGAARSIDRVLFRAAIAQVRIALGLGGGLREAELDQALADARQVLEASRQMQRAVPTENFVQYEAVCCQRLYRQGRHVELLARAGEAAAKEAGIGRVKHQIEFIGLKALAAQALGDAGAAQRDLLEAIRLAVPGSAALALVHCGPDLLKIRLDEVPLAAPAAARLRAWFDLVRKAAAEPAASAPAVPTLHRRELQILQLVEQGLRNREIGQRLYISEETVKWYLKRVYEALGVNNRAHALARVRQLKLGSP